MRSHRRRAARSTPTASDAAFDDTGATRGGRARRMALALVVTAAAFAGGVLAAGGDDAPAVRERVDMTWVGRNSGREVSREHVVMETRDDATVRFVADGESHPSPAVSMRTKSELVLDEETYFPLSIRYDLVTEAGERTIPQSFEVTMYANVAVVHTRAGAAESTQRVVMPAGTAFYDLNLIYPLQQFVHVYDDETGGRQAFDVFDVSRGKLEQAVFYRAGADTIEALGQRMPVRVYKLERKTLTTTVYADDTGRMVGVDLGFVRYSLEAWTREETPGS